MTWYLLLDANNNYWLFSPASNTYFTGGDLNGTPVGLQMVAPFGVVPVTLTQIESIVGTIPAAMTVGTVIQS